MLEVEPAEGAKSRSAGAAQVPELERLSLQNLFLQQQVWREQLNVLTLQFLQTANPKTLQDRIEVVTHQINALADKIFADANLDPAEYQLDVLAGTFIARSKSS
jgi:hypothetical protein